MRRASMMAILAMTGCVEYEFGVDPDEVLVPEGTCDLDRPASGTVAVDDACAGSAPIEVTDPWDLEIEWQYTAPTTDLGVIVMPAVGNLTDDDGDGRVTASDDPDVAFVTWNYTTGASLVALNGVDGSVIFQRPNYNGNAGVTIADVTGDGWPEVIAFNAASQVVAVGADGEPEWVSTPQHGLQMYPQPTVADLDNDGTAEVVFDAVVLDGVTGGTRFNVPVDGVNMWRTPVVADLNVDGQREIILGNGVFSSTGARLWTNPGTGWGNFAAVADVDGDPDGEVIFVSGSEMFVHDADGTVITRAAISGTNPGAPSVADFDGDGAVEIAIPANYAISMHEIDGTLVWSAAMQDASGLAGCSGYDVDGDGAYEVLFADETDLRIYDGRTGTVLFSDPTHDSGTVWEYPVIADVDNDGSAEILIASNSYAGYTGTGYRGVTLFGHAGSGWPKSGPTWGTHDFAVTNLLADGAVPTGEDPSWWVHNTFRARPAVDVPGLPDLFVRLDAPCLTTCGDSGEVEIPWQVGNRGPVRSPPGLDLGVFGRADGVETLLGTASLPPIEGGQIAMGGVLTVAASALHGADAVIARIDPGGSRLDCDPTDDEVVLDVAVCVE